MSMEIQYKDIPWIQSYPENKQYEELLKIINLGKSVIEFTQLSINPECSVLDPICKKFDAIEKETLQNRKEEYDKLENSRVLIQKDVSETTAKVNEIYQIIKNDQMEHKTNLLQIQDTINIFTKSTNKSSVKGKVSETIVQNIISNFFTDDTILDTSKESKAGDYQLIMNDGMKLMIEVKNYKNPVDKNEVDKFVRDIKHNKLNGIFISTTSKIVKKKLLEIEELPSGEITVYISNTGISGESIILGILLLKELIKRKANNNLSINTIDTSLILENIEQFADICKMISQMTSSIGTIKDTINKNLQDLYNESFKCQLEIKNIFNKIKYEITSELNKFDNNIDILEKENRENFLEQIKSEFPKLVTQIELLFNIEDTTNCKLSLTSEKWYILNINNEVICEIKKYKTKIEIKFVDKKTYCIQIELKIDNISLIESEILKAV